MPANNIVERQKMDWAKVQRTKDLRRQMTEEERLLWRHLRTHRLGDLHSAASKPSSPLQGGIKRGVLVDFYCHAAGLVVEVDGEVHQQQVEYDAERDRILAALIAHPADSQ